MLKSEDRAFLVLQPTRIEVPEHGTPPPLRVEVRARPAIRGRLQDTGGEPVPDTILLSQGPRPDLSRIVTTDAQGRFSFLAVRAEDPPITIRTAAEATHELVHESGPVLWGTERLILVAKRRAGSRVRVQFGVMPGLDCWPGFGVVVLDAAGVPLADARFTVEQELRWPGAPAGPHRILVMPIDPRLRLARQVTLDAGAPEETVRVTLDPMLPINVRALDAAGAPVGEATVECIDLGSAPFTPDGEALPRRALLEDARRLEAAIQLGRAVTDGDGYATIAVPLHGERAVLRLRASGFAPTSVACPERWVFDTELEVVMHRAR